MGATESCLEPDELQNNQTFVDDDYIPEWLWHEVDSQIDKRSLPNIDMPHKDRFQKLLAVMN